MTYEDTLTFLYSSHSSVYKNLDRIHYLLKALGDPQDIFPCVLIAGTNGKGSTAKMLSMMLRKAGYRVGCFTSPHLFDFAERITINGMNIAHEDVIALTAELKDGPLADLERDRACLGIEGDVSFFEMATAMGFVYFARQCVDIAIVEVGIGGRLDPTNTVNPLVSVITNVGLDHQQFLGDTIAAIAHEKAGIIHVHGDVVTGCQHPDALAVIMETCQQHQATCYHTGFQALERDIETFWNAHSIPHKVSSTGSFFDYHGCSSCFEQLYLRLSGAHQLANAAVALCTLEIVQQKGFRLPESAIRRGLADVEHPGRLEVIHTNPLCVVDIAHNAMGARTIAPELPELFSYEHLILIIGILHDKDVSEIVRPFLYVADSVIFTSPHLTDRAEAACIVERIAEDLASELYSPEAWRSRYQYWEICESIELAIRTAHTIAMPRDLIFVTGSNYTVSEAEMLIDVG